MYNIDMWFEILKVMSKKGDFKKKTLQLDEGIFSLQKTE